MPEIIDELGDLITDGLKIAYRLVGSLAVIGIIYKGLGWIFSLFS